MLQFYTRGRKIPALDGNGRDILIEGEREEIEKGKGGVLEMTKLRFFYTYYELYNNSKTGGSTRQLRAQCKKLFISWERVVLFVEDLIRRLY